MSIFPKRNQKQIDDANDSMLDMPHEIFNKLVPDKNEEWGKEQLDKVSGN